MELRLHLGVVAIVKGAFGSPSTKVTNITHFYFIELGVSIELNTNKWYVY